MNEIGSLIIQADIDQYPWNCNDQPKARASLRFLKEQGFQVTMRCWESPPKAIHNQPDSPVYQDSCLECFLNFYPEDGNRYLNFEVNSNGTMLCQAGENKTDRIFIRDLDLPQPKVETLIEETSTQAPFWQISYLIPYSLIKAIYGKAEFLPGQIIKGNFYKCGDLTQSAHYGCWSKIQYPKPNFHLPEFFGSMTIKT